MTIEIVLKYNPQYLPEVDGLDIEPSAWEWMKAARKAINAIPHVTVTATEENRDLHELWTYTDYQMDADSADQIANAIDRLTERGDWQMFVPGYVPENPAYARY